jgi:hypothetical protein
LAVLEPGWPAGTIHFLLIASACAISIKATDHGETQPCN